MDVICDLFQRLQIRSNKQYNNMKCLVRNIAVALCAATLAAACAKEEVFPITDSLYESLAYLWDQSASPDWQDKVDNYATRMGYTKQSDTLSGGSKIVSYLRQTDTAIYLLRTFNTGDTLLSLHCSLFSPRQRWMQNQTVRYEQEMYSRHLDGYAGGSFYWYIGPGSVDGGDVRSHSLFVERAAEHAGDVWEWVEARTRYGLHPPYLAEDRLNLHTDGTQRLLRKLGLDSIPSGITHHLDIQFNMYDTTGWSDPFIY